MFGLRLGLGHKIRFLVIKVKGWLGLALPPVLGFGLGKLRDSKYGPWAYVRGKV